MTERRPRVLHINDAAFTTATLLAEAARRGLPWEYLPLAQAEPGWQGIGGQARRAARGLAWEVRLAGAAARVDLLHVHVASVVRHTGWVPRPYVLHLHGTDARAHQYDPALAATYGRALASAAHVLYSTPDLAPHVRHPGAEFFPGPIDTATLPPWTPGAEWAAPGAPRPPARESAALDPGTPDRAPQRPALPGGDVPRILFTSRWSEVKGLAVQLAVARQLRTELGGTVELVGIDWGEGAGAAREAGVRLIPRLKHTDFQRLLATAHVAVGQPTGMLAVSELEALGIGVPVVAPLNPAWYGPGVPCPPVAGGRGLGAKHRLPPQDLARAVALPAAQGEALAAALATAAMAELAHPDPQHGQHRRQWVTEHHGAAQAVTRLNSLYSTLLAGGR